MRWKEARIVYNRLEDPGRGRGQRLIVGWALGKLELFSERAGSLDFPISKTVGSGSDRVRIVHQPSYREALVVRSAAGAESLCWAGSVEPVCAGIRKVESVSAAWDRGGGMFEGAIVRTGCWINRLPEQRQVTGMLIGKYRSPGLSLSSDLLSTDEPAEARKV